MSALLRGEITAPDGKTHRLVVSQPVGGGSFHIMIDNYYVGCVVTSPAGWIAYVDTNLLYSDDIGAILDAINS